MSPQILTFIFAHIHHSIYSDLWVVDADSKTRDTGIVLPPSIRDSLLGTLFSGCFSFFDRILNPNGRIRLPDVEGQSPGEQVGVAVKEAKLITQQTSITIDEIKCL